MTHSECVIGRTLNESSFDVYFIDNMMTESEYVIGRIPSATNDVLRVRHWSHSECDIGRVPSSILVTFIGRDCLNMDTKPNMYIHVCLYLSIIILK